MWSPYCELNRNRLTGLNQIRSDLIWWPRWKRWNEKWFRIGTLTIVHFPDPLRRLLYYNYLNPEAAITLWWSFSNSKPSSRPALDQLCQPPPLLWAGDRLWERHGANQNYIDSPRQGQHCLMGLTLIWIDRPPRFDWLFFSMLITRWSSWKLLLTHEVVAKFNVDFCTQQITNSLWLNWGEWDRSPLVNNCKVHVVA